MRVSSCPWLCPQRILMTRGGSRWPRTIQIRLDASVTTTEPAIAVASDQVIDRVAEHSWDQVEDPCPLPARKLARNAQRGFGFYIGLAGRHALVDERPVPDPHSRYLAVVSEDTQGTRTQQKMLSAARGPGHPSRKISQSGATSWICSGVSPSYSP